MTDFTKLLAIDMLIVRAREGDNRVLQIAAELAAEGNQFAKWLLESLSEKEKSSCQEPNDRMSSCATTKF